MKKKVLLCCLVVGMGAVTGFPPAKAYGQEAVPGIAAAASPDALAADLCGQLLRDSAADTSLQSLRLKHRDALASLAKISGKIIPYLVAEFKDTTKNWRYRFLMLSTLGRSGKNRAVIAPAVEALNDAQAEIRLYGVRFLGEMGPDAPVADLAALLNDEKRYIRSATVTALAKINDRRIIRPLLERMRNETEYSLRTDMLATLGKFKDETVYAQLADSLRYDRSPDVRSSAAAILGAYGEPRAVAALRDCLAKEQHPLVRLNIVDALATLDPDARGFLAQYAPQETNEVVVAAVQRVTGETVKTEEAPAQPAPENVPPHKMSFMEAVRHYLLKQQ